jgi:hypothetical protein
MQVLQKHLNSIYSEMSTENINLDKVIDMFKTTAELYSHTQVNLVNTILYPESNMSVKYPSDWYKPTTTFKLTQTFTFQPKSGKFFCIFYPNLLFDKSSGGTSLKLVSVYDTPNEDSNTYSLLFQDFSGKDFSSRLANALKKIGLNKVKEKINEMGALKLEMGYLDKLDLSLNVKDLEKQIESYNKITHIGNTDDDIFLNVPNSIIDQYRCNAAVLKIKGEDNQGVLLGTNTFFDTTTDEKALNQQLKYQNNFSNFAQEWLYKIEENPSNGIRVIKTPKDNSDMMFRNLNSRFDNEQVIMIAGKGLNPNSIYLLDVIQHIEFIPKLDMMDFFTPTIPMFSIGSKEQLFRSTSNFPIIGSNGSLIINSPTKIDKIMNLLKQYKNNGYNYTLWDVLTDSSIMTPEILSEINNTFYN